MVNPGREIREVLGDQVEIDVILRTGVRVGPEIDWTARIALLLGDAGGQEEHLGERRQVGDVLTMARAEIVQHHDVAVTVFVSTSIVLIRVDGF